MRRPDRRPPRGASAAQQSQRQLRPAIENRLPLQPRNQSRCAVARYLPRQGPIVAQQLPAAGNAAHRRVERPPAACRARAGPTAARTGSQWSAEMAGISKAGRPVGLATVQQGLPQHPRHALVGKLRGVGRQLGPIQKHAQHPRRRPWPVAHGGRIDGHHAHLGRAGQRGLHGVHVVQRIGDAQHLDFVAQGVGQHEHGRRFGLDGVFQGHVQRRQPADASAAP